MEGMLYFDSSKNISTVHLKFFEHQKKIQFCRVNAKKKESLIVQHKVKHFQQKKIRIYFENLTEPSFSQFQIVSLETGTKKGPF